MKSKVLSKVYMSLSQKNRGCHGTPGTPSSAAPDEALIKMNFHDFLKSKSHELLIKFLARGHEFFKSCLNTKGSTESDLGQFNF